MRLLKRVWAFFDTILDLLAVLGMVLLTFMMLSVCWEVVTRYLLGSASVWVIEFSEYILLYITFLGTAWLLRNEGHVEMDILITLLSPKPRLIVKSVTSILGGVICFIVAWSGAEVSLDHLQRGLHQPTLMEPPDFPLFAVIPLGFFLLSIQFLRRAYGYIESWRVKPDMAQESYRPNL